MHAPPEGEERDREAVHGDGAQHHERNDGLDGRCEELLLALGRVVRGGELLSGEGGDEYGTCALYRVLVRPFPRP